MRFYVSYGQTNRMKFPATLTSPWAWWQRIVFRFFFLFYCIFLGPWSILSVVPGTDFIRYYYTAFRATALFFNTHLFHIPAATLPPNGNGDYPEQWMEVCMSVTLAIAGTLIWSLLDRKRKNYTVLNYWFCLWVRYFIIMTGFIYGIIKLFCLQMPFPSISQFATPLGDYLPMRFSWMFVGYSTTYQFFSGGIEVVAAVLLLFRKTATLGVLIATGVFFNVMMLNLSYDIPVKINSMSMVVLCLYLLVQEMPRLYRFFVQLQATPSPVFLWPYESKRGRIIAIAAKWIFVALVLYSQLEYSITAAARRSAVTRTIPVPSGIYDVVKQTTLGDTIDISKPDSLYWQNIVFEKTDDGSIKTTDKRFRQRYGRGYFNAKFDSATQVISLRRSFSDSTFLAQFNYHIKDSIWVELTSYPNKDSMYLLLRRRTAPFPLSERPFHWVSETNR
ncbi:hypothetical protein D3H65_15825 [Paraflavitalea soli]|uniref:DoxX family protein n=1 Tax=Paraflavitalea soli TaxID=2315862 RepID=A0A3B7MLR1_9BACT|nr:hypothetical protein [Paraflavitalea soli]AXY75362.1 hypothetical protein D3H65_15825 [Paraflavitalea soli]